MRLLGLLVLWVLCACAPAPTGPAAVTLEPEGVEVAGMSKEPPTKISWGDIEALEVVTYQMEEHTFEQLLATVGGKPVLICTARWNKAPHQQGFAGTYYGHVRVADGDFDTLREGIVEATGLTQEGDKALWVRGEGKPSPPAGTRSFVRLPMKMGPPR